MNIVSCNLDGGALCCREYLVNGYPKLQQESQWLKADVKVNRGQHPFFLARYCELDGGELKTIFARCKPGVA